MENATNLFVIVLFYIIRCVIPLLVMLGVSYLLKKLGLMSEPPSQTGHSSDTAKDNENHEGEFAHGKI
jgi:hypothetical protein